jgi:hypothetical protein
VKNVKTTANNSFNTKQIKIAIVGLLLFSLIACEKNKPETTEINLNLPNINGIQPSTEVISNESNALEASTTATITDQVGRQPYPMALNFIAKNKQQFAPDLLSSLFISDKFYPLGWSADGKKLAYGIEQSKEESRSSFVSVFIQDLVSDKIIWTLNKSSPQRENYFEHFWKNNHQHILTAFNKYNIALASNGLTLNTTSLTYGADTFSYTVKAKQAPDGQIQSYRVLLNSKTKGSKEISKGQFKRTDLQNGDYASKEKIAVIGYFQGADKARVATLLGLMEKGEGGMKIMHYNIIGASLKYGKWH